MTTRSRQRLEFYSDGVRIPEHVRVRGLEISYDQLESIHLFGRPPQVVLTARPGMHQRVWTFPFSRRKFREIERVLSNTRLPVHVTVIPDPEAWRLEMLEQMKSQEPAHLPERP